MLDPLKADFRNVLFLVIKHVLGKHINPTPVQYDIAEYLQNGPKRMLVEAFRGVGKSFITAAFVVWCLLNNPDHKIMVVSASKPQADNFSAFVLSLIKSIPEFSHLTPSADQRESKVQFDVHGAVPSRDPSVKSMGITGQLTGSRGDIVVVDDCEVPGNSATQMQREKLASLIKEFDAIVKPGGRIIFLGTPQSEQSIYSVLPERGYSVRIWPARFPSADQVNMYGESRLAPIVSERLEKDPSLAGKSTDPLRFNDIDLAERELSYGRSGFALQFMLDTRLSDALRYPLKVADLIVHAVDSDVAPEKLVWASDPKSMVQGLPVLAFNGDHFYRPMAVVGSFMPYTQTVMAIDPSGRGQDELGYAVVKSLNSQLFLSAAGGIQGGYSKETIEALVTIAVRQKVRLVVIESNFGDGMFTELVKPYFAKHGIGVEEVRHSKQKELRIIDTLEPVMNQHRLVVDPKVIEADYQSILHYPPDLQNTYSLFWQLTRLTRDRGALRHDDRLDALAIAVAYFVEAMAKDQDTAMADNRRAAMDLEIRKFLEDHDAGDREPAGWFERR